MSFLKTIVAEKAAKTERQRFINEIHEDSGMPLVEIEEAYTSGEQKGVVAAKMKVFTLIENKKSSLKYRNPVVRHAGTFNKNKVEIDRKKDVKAGKVKQKKDIVGEDFDGQDKRAYTVKNYADSITKAGGDHTDALRRARRSTDEERAKIWKEVASLLLKQRRNTDKFEEDSGSANQMYAIWDTLNKYWVNKPTANLGGQRRSAEKRNMEYGRMVYLVKEYNPEKPGLPGKVSSYS